MNFRGHFIVKSVKYPMPSFIFPDSTGVGQLILQFWTISGREDFFWVWSKIAHILDVGMFDLQ